MNKDKTKELIIKSFKIEKLDEDKLKKGIISGIGNKVNIVDKSGDKIMPGAFTKTIKKKPTVWALVGHNWSSVMGLSHLKEMEDGSLWVDMELNLDTQIGRDNYEIIQKGFKEGLEPMFSIGGRIEDGEFVDDERDKDAPYRKINEFNIREVSFVLQGANQESYVETIKSKKQENIKGEKEMSVKDLKEKDPVVKSDEVVDEAVEAVKEVEKGEGCSKSADEVVEKSITNNYYTVSKSDETKEEKVDEELKSFELLQAKGRKDYETVKALGTSGFSNQTVLPNGTLSKIIEKVKDESELFSAIEFIPAPSGRFEFAVSGNYGTAGAAAEAGNYADGDESVSTVSVVASKVATLQKVSEELLNFSPAWFQGWLTNRIAGRVRDKVEDYLLNGTGSSNQPTGLLVDSNITSAGTTATKGKITISEVEKLLESLPGSADRGAKLVMNKATWLAILALKDSQGAYLFKDYAGYQDRANLSLRGYQVILSDKMPKLSEGGKKPILFGNISNPDYLGAVVGWGLNVKVLTELYAASGQIGYAASTSFGFAVLQPSAFKVIVNKA